jgi:hypothetical protein
MAQQVVRSVLLLLLLSTAAVLADIGLQHYCTREQLSAGYPKKGVCGRQLVELVRAVCGGLHASGDMARADKPAFDESDQQQTDRPGMAPQLQSSSRRVRRNIFQGLACDCCVHQCSLANIAEYC